MGFEGMRYSFNGQGFISGNMDGRFFYGKLGWK
jgi:hypothetical protein